MLTDRQILEVRSHFPLLREKTWLYNCSQGALSDAVEGALKDYGEKTGVPSFPDITGWLGRGHATGAAV
jgi:hypothetical protein